MILPIARFIFRATFLFMDNVLGKILFFEVADRCGISQVFFNRTPVADFLHRIKAVKGTIIQTAALFTRFINRHKREVAELKFLLFAVA